jgi:hypothetical protein
MVEYLKATAKKYWCRYLHLGRIKFTPDGKSIDWQCSKCGRWSGNPIRIDGPQSSILAAKANRQNIEDLWIR